MTIEAALAKLMFLFGKGLTPSEVARMMGVSLVGEATVN